MGLIMTELLITVGLPASGKTSYAVDFVRENDYFNVNRDDIRNMIRGGFENANEKLVTKIQHNAIDTILKVGGNVISSDTNLVRRNVRKLVSIAKQHSADVKFEYFDVHPEECKRRNNNRVDQVPSGVIDRMAKSHWNYKTFQVPRFDDLFNETKPNVEKYVPVSHKPNTIIVDLDGTCAVHNGRSPYDYDQLHTDLPNKQVIDLVKREYWNGKSIVFVTGRPDSHYNQTSAWISEHINIMPDIHRSAVLLMRNTGDRRQDFKIKQEIFDQYIRHNHNVLYCLDDRKQVIDMWRSLGLTVLDVAGHTF